MSQLGESVIPDEHRFAERDPWFDRPFDRLTVLSKVEGLTTLSEVEGESSKGSTTSSGVWCLAFAGTLSGSRLASRFAGLGRDDRLRHRVLGERRHVAILRS